MTNKAINSLSARHRTCDKGTWYCALVDLGLAAVHLDKAIPLCLDLVTLTCSERAVSIVLWRNLFYNTHLRY